jgi:phosphatidate cytidylyltransferase
LKNFIQRSITGIIYVAILIAGILLHPIVFALIFACITALGLLEYYKLTTSETIRPWKYTGLVTGLILFIINFLFASGLITLHVLLGAILFSFVIFFFGLIRWREKMVVSLGITYLGILYIVVPVSLLVYFCFPDHELASYNYEILLGYLFILWLYDTGAYISGSLLGKHKMIETISPSKTWEGFAGGLIVAIATAIVTAQIFTTLTLSGWIIVSLITVITGTLGDIAESAIKRNAGMKDSGNLLPGHGGILDRIDSILLSVPFVLVYLLMSDYF